MQTRKPRLYITVCPHAASDVVSGVVWRDVSQVLLDTGYKASTGSPEDDGCWADFL